MSKHIHLNLINEVELVSSSPVRSRIITPAIIAILTLTTLAWWLYEGLIYIQLNNLNEKYSAIESQLQPGYQSVLELNSQEKALIALNAQLKAYQNSKLFFGEALDQIPKYVLHNIQFSKLEIPAPPPPLFEKDHAEKGPTNTTESVKIVITGRTTGANAFDAVDQLLKALTSNHFTNLICSAHIPKGSFRQDIAKASDDKEYLLFGLECQCHPRIYK